MFNGAENFNQPLESWNVSNVTNMTHMFSGAKKFNQPLESWNVSNVTNMRYMFYDAENFNQPLNNWNISNVTDIGYMFTGADNFNQPLKKWNVIYIRDMSSMFTGARRFDIKNKPLSYEERRLLTIEKNKHTTGLLTSIGRNSVKQEGQIMNRITNEPKSNTLQAVSGNKDILKNINSYLGGRIKSKKTARRRKHKNKKTRKKTRKTRMRSKKFN